LGFRSRVCRSTLADANEARDWRIYADLATLLIKKARRLYAGQPLEVDLQQSVYALDSTTIELCLNLFRWARFQSTKAAIKLHTLLDLRGPIPAFIDITEGRCHDVSALEGLVVEPGAFYVMDRGYLDFGRLHTLHEAGAYFVIRARKDLRFVRYVSQPIDADTGLCSDHIGRLRGFYSRKAFPDKLRVVRFYDRVQERRFCFLSNHLRLPALTICQLYKMRWHVELFFKWIKQHLRIKRFYGNSTNAVKTQVWIAMCVYALVAIVKKELHLPQSLHSILQVLSVSVFEKVPLRELLTTTLPENYDSEDRKQLRLWNL
jgi:Transposase DDE domain